MKKLCKHCGKVIEFEKTQQIGGHITFCSKNPNKKKKLKTRKISYFNCLRCGTPYQLEITDEKIKKGDYKKFCSRKCANVRIHNEETKKKISISLIGHKYPNRKGRVWSDESKQKVSNSLRGRKRKSRPWSKEMKEKFSIIAKERYRLHPELHPNRKCAGIKESYPEKCLREYFELKGLKKEIDFFQQYPVSSYFVDFFLPKLNLSIEVDGERWHSENEREHKRELTIKKVTNIIRYKAKKLIDKQYQNEIDNIINAVVS